MSAYAAPGLYVAAPAPVPPPIDPLRTDVAAFVGIAERGPVGVATWVSSWQQYTGLFGGFLRGAYLTYAVKAFFDNGGELCAVVRVAAQEARTASAGVQLSRDVTTVASVGALVPGALATVAQLVTVDTAGAQPADRTRTVAADAAPFAEGATVVVSQAPASVFATVAATDPAASLIFWKEALPAAIDLTQPFSLTTGLLVEQLVGSVDAPTGRITWAAPLDDRIRIGAGAPPLAVSSGAAAASAQLAVDPGAVLLDIAAQSPGTWGDTLEAAVTRAADGSFSLAIYQSGELSELYTRLSSVAGDPREAPVVVGASSRLITVGSVEALPPSLPPTRLRLSGGRDGTAALRADDFTGAPDDPVPRGLGALQNVDGISILAVPDAVIRPVSPLPPAVATPQPAPDPCVLATPPSPAAAPPTPPPQELAPALTNADVLTIQRALVAQCEDRRDRIALLDPPLTVTEAVSSLVAWRDEFDTSYAALYHPWVLVVDPMGVDGLVRAIPPCGHVAGALARTDLASGVQTPPANAVLDWAQGPTANVDSATQAVLNPLGINCLRVFLGRGFRVYGERTLSSDPMLTFLNVRRLLAMIETAIGQATQWAVFEGNDAYIRELVRVSIASFLHELWQDGAFAGATESDAYFVQCDDLTNPPDQVALGQLVALVGVAPVRPAEFVVLRISRIEGSLQVAAA